MNICEPFIRRPIATTLLTLAIALAGAVAYLQLPVSPLPQIDSPTISVSASLPGAAPEIVASSIATPLERQFGRIAGITEMSSSSSLGSTNITLQFDLSRNIDAAARDVEAAINAARGNLPANLPSNPSYKKVNPADAPIMIIALTSPTATKGQMYDIASTVLAQKISQVSGVGQVTVGGSSLPGVRVELNPTALNKYGIGLESVRNVLSAANANVPKGHLANENKTWTVTDNDQLFNAVDYVPLVIAYRNGAAVRVGDVADVVDSVEDVRQSGYAAFAPKPGETVKAQPAVLLVIFRQPGANIIHTVDLIMGMLPQLSASIPPVIKLKVVMERTSTVRASIVDVEHTLVLSVLLVILVVFLFLRDVRAMFIPSIAVVVSLIGTFGVMYLLNFSLDNLSLMALTISTRFVVDDAIVVVENITRYIEKGLTPVQAALRGSAEIGFTVLSISLSLVAVFIPILLMSGLIGRLFREFAVTLAVAIGVSMVISLTTTPMMCAMLLKKREGDGEVSRGDAATQRGTAGEIKAGGGVKKREGEGEVSRGDAATRRGTAGEIKVGGVLKKREGEGEVSRGDAATQRGTAGEKKVGGGVKEREGEVSRGDAATQRGTAGEIKAGGGKRKWSSWLYWKTERVFEGMVSFYDYTLTRVLWHPALTLLVLIAMVALNGFLFYEIPKGFFPQQDTGRLGGNLQADQDTSFQAMNQRLLQMIQIIQADPDVESLAGFSGSSNTARTFITLKDWGIRKSTADEVIARLVPKLSVIPGATMYLQSQQDLRFGGMQTNAQYQYVLQSDTFADVSLWAPKLLAELKKIPILTQVNSSQQNNGLQATLTYDRDTAARFGISSQLLDATLYDAFGQRQVSTMFTALNQYHVVMEAAPQYWQNPETLRDIYVTSAAGQQVPLSALTRYEVKTAPLSVSHSGPFSAVTLSFNLALGSSLGDAVNAVNEAKAKIGLPDTVRGAFAGTAQAFQDALWNEVILIGAALTAVYIVLGILYESFVHPITIITTLPSAGVGAVLALMATNTELSLIAMIGVILLIGIVKKNAIMMIDFALAAEREEGMKPQDAIHQACLLRFRPILMTTMAAMLGALPLALDTGTGGELRRPLGIAIIGGLLFSQVLTLYTTPVIYLYWDRLAVGWRSLWARRETAVEGREVYP